MLLKNWELPQPFSNGGFAVVHKARLASDDGSECRAVAVKFPDVHRHIGDGGGSQSDEKRRKLHQRRQREIRAGQSVSHPNILPFLGYCDNPDPDFKEFVGIVLPFCANGHALAFVKAHPKVNRVFILCGVAAVICALHSSSPPVVHGDVKASNILIDDSGQPYLADFGLSRICDTKGFTTQNIMGTCRWMAVELFQGNDDDNEPVRTTTGSDVWAFAMTIMEILTGNIPFADKPSDAKVLFEILVNKARPKRPNDSRVTDAIWTLLQYCWQEDASVRPDAVPVGLVLDIIYSRSPGIDSNSVTEILEGVLDRAEPRQISSSSCPTPLPYMCKWSGCSQRFNSLSDCIEHECAEFERRHANAASR